jgi:glycosyltransferase involved in cell wall biosynthesis
MYDVIELDPNHNSTTSLVRQVPASVVEAEIKAAHKPEDKFETVLFLPEGEGRKGEGGLRTQGYFKQSHTDKPLITVVTVVFNGEKFLEETILSVINQTYDNVEYIIIDGGSTDGTLDIIRKYEHAIDYWVSEKDKGIYDAMNKGIQQSNGDYVGLINADDWYELDAVETIVNAIIINDEPDIIYANMNVVDIENNKKKLLKGDINSIHKNMSINHPTCFVKRKLYNEKLFDTKYRIAADYELMLYFYINKKIFCYVDKVLAYMRSGGVSANNSLTIKERYNIHVLFFLRMHAGFELSKFLVKVYVRNVFSFFMPKKITDFMKGYR